MFLGYNPLHKGYKCLHVPSNRVYISRDVIFDENVFSFLNIPNSHTLPPVTESSLLSDDQFMDVAHSLPLLADHGAGTGRGTRLEVLIPTPAPAYVDHQPQVVHFSVPGSVPVQGSSSGCVPYAPAPHAPASAPASLIRLELADTARYGTAGWHACARASDAHVPPRCIIACRQPRVFSVTCPV